MDLGQIVQGCRLSFHVTQAPVQLQRFMRVAQRAAVVVRRPVEKAQFA